MAKHYKTSVLKQNMRGCSINQQARGSKSSCSSPSSQGMAAFSISSEPQGWAAKSVNMFANGKGETKLSANLSTRKIPKQGFLGG